MILADTSAWIGYVRGDDTPAALRLRVLLSREDGALSTTEPVQMELLMGARDAKQERGLRRLLAQARPLPFDAVTDFEAATGIYQRCRRVGVTPRGIVDCMIAAVAWRRGAVLLAHDVDLDRVAGVMGVAVDEASLRA